MDKMESGSRRQDNDHLFLISIDHRPLNHRPNHMSIASSLRWLSAMWQTNQIYASALISISKHAAGSIKKQDQSGKEKKKKTSFISHFFLLFLLSHSSTSFQSTYTYTAKKQSNNCHFYN